MSLYDKYGGSGTVQTLVQKFYNRIQNDKELERFFKGVDFKKLIDHQVQFVSQVLGGPITYKGQSMAYAHKNLKISQYDFDLVANHFLSVLKELKVEKADIKVIMEQLAGLAPDIITAK